MKVLFDTNVVLDVLLAREPFGAVALELVSLADKGVSRVHSVRRQ